MLNPELLAILRCPKCRGVLKEKEETSALLCQTCRLSYAIQDGIPNLLIEEAQPLQP